MTGESLERLRQGVFEYLHGLGFAKDEAEEFAAETLLVLCTRERAGLIPGNPLAFARGVAWRKAIAGKRRARERSLALGAGWPARTAKTDPSALREWLDAAFAELPSDDRRLLDWRYREACSERAIAERLGVPRGTAARRLHSARHALREALRRTQGAPLALFLPPGTAPPVVPALVAAKAGVFLTAIGGALMLKTALVLSAIAAIALALLWPDEAVRDPLSLSSQDRSGATAESSFPAPEGTRPNQERRALIAQSEFQAGEARWPQSWSRVVDRTGLPVAGATVSLWHRDFPTETQDLQQRVRARGGRSVSDAAGSFALAAEDFRGYALLVAAPGFAMTIAEQLGPTLPPEFSLADDEPLRGMIVTSEGQAIPSADVCARISIGRARTEIATRTDAEGRFALFGLPTASLRFLDVLITVDHPEFAPAVLSLSSLDRTEESRIALSRGQSIQGTVTAEGKPIAGVALSLWSLHTSEGGFGALQALPTTARTPGPTQPSNRRVLMRTITDRNGFYRFDRVPVASDSGGLSNHLSLPMPGARPGSATQLGGLVAVHPQFAPAAEPLAADGLEGLTITKNLELFPAARLKGQIVDERGRGLPFVRVRVHAEKDILSRQEYSLQDRHAWRDFVPGEPAPLGAWVETDAEGHFDHPGVAGTNDRASLWLTACACRIAGPTVEHRVTDLIPAEGAPLQLRFPGQLRRFSFRDEDDHPLESQTIRIARGRNPPPDSHPLTPWIHSGSFTDVLIDAEGCLAIFEAKTLRKSNAEALVYAFEVGGMRRHYHRPEPTEDIHVIRLERGLSIAGRVLLPEGIDPRFTRLLLQPHNEPERRVESSLFAGQEFAFGGLPPGPYDLLLAGDTAKSAQLLQTVSAGEDNLWFDLRALLASEVQKEEFFECKVLVSDAATGAPIEGAELWLHADPYRPGHSGRRGMSSAPGRVTFQRVQAGPARLELRVPGQPSRFHPIVLDPMQAHLEWRVERGLRIAGVLRFPPEVTERRGAVISLRDFHSQELLAEVTTDKTGAFAFSGLKPLRFGLSARADPLAEGATGRDKGLGVPELAWVDLRGGQSVETLSLSLVPTATLQLSVRAEDRASYGVQNLHGLDLRVLDSNGGVLQVWRGSGEGPLSPLLWTKTASTECALAPGDYTLELRWNGRPQTLTAVSVPGAAEIPLKP